MHGEEVLLSFLGPQKCNPKKVWLTLSQVDEVTSPLCAVSQKHEDERMESTEFISYQYGVGLMTLANLSLGASAQLMLTICPSAEERICSSNKNSHSLSSMVAAVRSIFKCLRIPVSQEPSAFHSIFG